MCASTAATVSPTVPPSARLAAGATDVPILGDLLTDLNNRVQMTIQGVIDRAEGAAAQLTIDAGRQVNLAIQDLKNAYEEELAKTVDKIDQVAIKNLYQLEEMVTQFQANNTEFLADAASRVQQLINSLPFSNLRPQLREVKPRNIVVASNPSQLLTFSGNFPFSSDSKFPAKLVFGSSTYSPEGNETQTLRFQVPINCLFPSAGAPLYDYRITKGELQIPWDNTSNLPWYQRLAGYTDYRTATFQVMLAALPLSPGRITAIYSKQVDGPLMHSRFISPTQREDASHAYPKSCKDWDTHRYTYQPQPGWKFVPQSARIVLESNPPPHGNHQESFRQTAEDQLEALIQLDACSGKHMGQISFHVECDQIKPTSNEETSQMPIDMRWGDNARLVPLSTDQGGLKMLLFEAFDGSRYEFGPVTDLKNRYIKVYNQGTNLQLIAMAPNDLEQSFVQQASR